MSFAGRLMRGRIDDARMGLAVLLDQENCLNFQGLRCDVCYRVCPAINEAITLEHAIRSMTSLSAGVMALERRGVIASGRVADIAVFDLELIRDNATYDDPHQLCEGMEYVLINGSVAVDRGEFTDTMSGRVLNRRGG